jgi:hypothetical protein
MALQLSHHRKLNECPPKKSPPPTVIVHEG